MFAIDYVGGVRIVRVIARDAWLIVSHRPGDGILGMIHLDPDGRCLIAWRDSGEMGPPVYARSWRAALWTVAKACWDRGRPTSPPLPC